MANFSAALTGTAHYYTLDTTKTPAALNATQTCTFATGQMADVAISDVFYDSCTNVPQPIPTTLKDIPGPVQAMLFVVPKANTGVQYLTAAEAADIYGCGSGAGIAGFSEAGGIFCRDPNSGTQITIAKNIGVAASVIVPPLCVTTSAGTSGVITNVETYANPMAAIGFIGADAYDAPASGTAAAPRTAMSSLAFAGFGQTQGLLRGLGCRVLRPKERPRRSLRGLGLRAHARQRRHHGRPHQRQGQEVRGLDQRHVGRPGHRRGRSWRAPPAPSRPAR